MELRLIGKPNNEESKTEFKITQKEFKEVTWLHLWLIRAGADLTKPSKQNSRYIYFIVNGDYLNGPKIKNTVRKED